MSDQDHKKEFDFERISILFANTTTGYLGIGAASACLAYVIGIMSTPLYAGIWLFAMFVT